MVTVQRPLTAWSRFIAHSPLGHGLDGVLQFLQCADLSTLVQHADRGVSAGEELPQGLVGARQGEGGRDGRRGSQSVIALVGWSTAGRAVALGKHPSCVSCLKRVSNPN